MNREQAQRALESKEDVFAPEGEAVVISELWLDLANGKVRAFVSGNGHHEEPFYIDELMAREDIALKTYGQTLPNHVLHALTRLAGGNMGLNLGAAARATRRLSDMPFPDAGDDNVIGDVIHACKRAKATATTKEKNK